MGASAADYEHCSALLAQGDRDRWLAALFVPADKRPHIHAIHAFAHEIERVPHIISDPRLGEIRLQWWREVLEGTRSGEAALNPVSAALLAAISERRLPAQALIDLVEAHRFDLYADPMPTLNDLEGWCGETSSALFRLASMVLSDGAENGSADASGHAGVAWGLTSILRALPFHAARGQCFIPKDVLARHGALPEAAVAGLNSPAMSSALAELRNVAQLHLQKARAATALLPQDIRSAFVPLAVVPLYLKAMERRNSDPFRVQPEVAQWRRQWAMWRWS